MAVVKPPFTARMDFKCVLQDVPEIASARKLANIVRRPPPHLKSINHAARFLCFPLIYLFTFS